MNNLEILSKIADAVLKQAKTDLVLTLKDEGRTDHENLFFEEKAAWDLFDWRREDHIEAVINRMVKR